MVRVDWRRNHHSISSVRVGAILLRVFGALLHFCQSVHFFCELLAQRVNESRRDGSSLQILHPITNNNYEKVHLHAESNKDIILPYRILSYHCQTLYYTEIKDEKLRI